MNNNHFEKPQRASGIGVKLALSGVAGNLALASVITMSLIGGMVLVLVLGLVFISGSENPGMGFAIAVTITLIFNLAAFFCLTLVNGFKSKMALSHPLGFSN